MQLNDQAISFLLKNKVIYQYQSEFGKDNVTNTNTCLVF